MVGDRGREMSAGRPAADEQAACVEAEIVGLLGEERQRLAYSATMSESRASGPSV